MRQPPKSHETGSSVTDPPKILTAALRDSGIPAVRLFLLASLLVPLAQAQQPDVGFIEKTPVIDGILDPQLTGLPKKTFNHVLQLDNPSMDPVKVAYRMGYTPTHFYLHIETDAAGVSYHRRGYLWGDGYKLLLGIPQERALTNEYYEMAFSPTQEEDYLWAKQRIVSYNFLPSNKSLSSKTLSQEYGSADESGFEALIAWSDLRPYHPWFTEKLGYNLYFAKGFDTKEHGYFPYGYVVIEDEGIWDEELEHRAYVLLTFEIPTRSKEQVVLAQPARGHISVATPLDLRVATIGPQAERIRLEIDIVADSGQSVSRQVTDVDISTARATQVVRLPTESLDVGDYKIRAVANGQASEHSISIIPKFQFTELRATLTQNNGPVSESTAHTLLFALQSIETQLSNLRPYDSAQTILKQWAKFESHYSTYKTGRDPYSDKRGPYRRGFKSKQDGTYQPYSIKLPKNYDPRKSYPLLVFLHGSGQDEQRLLDRERSNGEFIELAPFGRDKFRAYASAASQKDIVESIEAARSAFSIDENRIIVGGFSMGGYGALRAFYEHPEIYKGVAVFAGHPNLASEWSGEEHPNFLDEAYLRPFAKVPVFIYHGRKDPAVNVKLMEQASLKLEAAGALVTKRFVAEHGHEYQDAETHACYSDWLDQVVR